VRIGQHHGEASSGIVNSTVARDAFSVQFRCRPRAQPPRDRAGAHHSGNGYHPHHKCSARRDRLLVHSELGRST
jgi:hypothetical protein